MVAGLLGSIHRNGFSWAEALDLDNKWRRVLESWPSASVDWDYLVFGDTMGIGEFAIRVNSALEQVTKIVQEVVVLR